MNKLLLILLLSFTHSALALTAKEIMTKNEAAHNVKDFEAQAKLTTGPAIKIKDFTLWRKIQKDGIHNSTFTRFHAPAEVRNEGILILENTTGKNDVLLYLPNFKKTRRVESQQQSGSFMGSVFSYSDIATAHTDDYQYKTLGEEKCLGEAKLNCTKIECTPSSDEIKDRTGYSKSIVWVRPDNFMIEKADYYNREGKLFKKMTSSEIKQVDSQNNKWLSHNLYITNLDSNEYTRLQFSNVKVNVGISDATFTQQNLEKTK